MILGRQIHSLLKRHSAVFVKGLGTFTRIRTSASFDAKRKVVLPPLSYIEFEHLVQEGFDFTLYVQQSNQVEKAEADILVEEQVNKLIEIINRDGQATLDELGQLVAYGYTYIFKPLDLSGFQFLPLEDHFYHHQEEVETISEVSNTNTEQSAPEVTITPDGDSVLKDLSREEKTVLEEVFHIEQKTAEVSVPNEEITTPPFYNGNEYVEKPSNKSNRGLIYGLVAVAALIILGGIYYYSIINNNNFPGVGQFSYLDSAEDEVTLQPEIIDSSDVVLVDSVPAADTDSSVVIKEEQPNTIELKEDNKFTIVIGMHPKMEQAEEEAANYHKKGYKNVRALVENSQKGRKKVIWDTYPTKELRDSALRYVQKNINKEAWPTVLK